LVLEDGRRWGEAAAAWQWADARVVLEVLKRFAYLTRPRGGSKTTDLAGIAIAALVELLPPASRSYAAAADRDQARLLVDAMDGLVTRTPEMRGALKVDTWRVTATRTGATLDVLAADAAGTWGLKPHLLQRGPNGGHDARRAPASDRLDRRSRHGGDHLDRRSPAWNDASVG
jgi:hypothetical protein